MEFYLHGIKEAVTRVLGLTFGEKNSRKNVECSDDNVFKKLSVQCRMGDIEAMYEMAVWHRRKCTGKELKILLAYEKRPDDQKAQEEIRYIWCRNIQNYAVWLVRSALYGHSKAGKILEQYSLYREISLIPAWMMNPAEAEQKLKNRHQCMFEKVEGWELRQAGFTDVPEEEFDGSLRFLNKEGFYVFSYLSDYIPADEDGFGREDYYESVYFDEFFNLLPEGIEDLPPEMRKKELDKMDAKREQYWNSPLCDSRRKYKERMRQLNDRNCIE